MRKNMYNASVFTLILIGIVSCKSDNMEFEKMVKFGERYTEAWNSRVPANMAAHYAEDGTLIINNGTPSKGRAELAASAESFMVAFPDLHLTMDSLVEDSGKYNYHWTFSGTNTGPGGTGNKVVFSGFERWTMNEEGLIQSSIGTFDAEDYARQINAVK